MKTIVEIKGVYVPYIETLQDVLNSLFPNADITVRELPAQAEQMGCFCDLDIGQKPDACVFDNGDICDCIYAEKLQKENKGKASCIYWLPVRALPQPEQGQGEIKLLGIKCKCAKGHIWNCACATIWTQMPWCPECGEDRQPAISFSGLWQSVPGKVDDNLCSICGKPLHSPKLPGVSMYHKNCSDKEFVACCGKLHEIIQWTYKGPLQYGAECSVCGKRLADENPSALKAAWGKVEDKNSCKCKCDNPLPICKTFNPRQSPMSDYCECGHRRECHAQVDDKNLCVCQHFTPIPHLLTHCNICGHHKSCHAQGEE
jgi:hypothetical protein